MLDIVRDEIQRLREQWIGQAQTLKSFGAFEATATTERLIGDLGNALQNIEARAARLSVKDYAAINGVKPDTVCRWIRTRQLPASRAADGSWTIPYGAVRRKLRKVA